jgi:hypothetical protein
VRKPLENIIFKITIRGMALTSDKSKIYVESSTISYLTARPSRDVIVKAKQKLTHKCWNQRNNYNLFISNTVIEEIMMGDPEAAEARLKIAKELTVLPLTETVEHLTDALLESGAVPEKSKLDASHIAHAAVHHMDFLITWNQKHIATDKKRKRIEAIIEEFGFKPLPLLTPERHMIFEET